MSPCRPSYRLPRTVRLAAAASLLLAAASGCQGDRTAPSGRQPGPGSGQTSSQTQMGGGNAQETFPNYGRLVEDLSIGLADGPAEYLFGFVADIAAGPEGSIYVADSRAKVLRQYDANGRFVRSFGREGRGPGEFNVPVLVAVHPDGRVLVGDEGRSGDIGADRILVFSPEGMLLDTWNFPDLIEGPITFDTAGTIYVRINGEFVSNGGPFSRPGNRPGATPRASRGVIWASVYHGWHPPMSPGTIRLRPDGTVLDTIAAHPSPELPYWQPDGVSGRVYMVYQYTPFSWSAWTPEGHLLSGSSSEYSIQVHEAGRATGPPLRQLRRAVSPVPVVADEREESRDAYNLAGGSNPGRWVGTVELPASKPAYHSVFVGREGRVWVGVHLPSVRISDDWVEPVTAFDVWDPAGEYVGRVEGPSSIRAAVIDGDMLLTTTRDELGVDRVVRYRVEWE